MKTPRAVLLAVLLIAAFILVMLVIEGGQQTNIAEATMASTFTSLYQTVRSHVETTFPLTQTAQKP